MSPSRTTVLSATFFAATARLLAGCSSSDDGPAANADAGTDGAFGVEAGAEAGGEAGAPAGTGRLAGTVKDEAGLPVLGAKVELGALAKYTDSMGHYALTDLAPGPATVKVTRNWFKDLETSVTIAATDATALDVTFVAFPLAIDPADRTAAEAYAKTFDWTKDPISISIVPRPTRRDFDNAVYFHNPALYKDRAGEAPLTPAPQPEITALVAKNFTFKVLGKNEGQEALDPATIADAPQDTPLGPTEPAEWMMAEPMIKWLREWDATKAADLQAVVAAVRLQNWGGNSVQPQDVEKVYLDAAHGALWVKVVFQSFVQLGAGIADDDGDGLKEIYAQVAAVHVTPEVLDKLANEYGKKLFTTHTLGDEINESLRDLYSRTNAQVERYIGQPFDVPGVGMIKYPFVVLKHAGVAGKKNVILVAPAP